MKPAVVAFVAVMNQLGVEWTGLLTLLSAFTVAIGLSLQDVIKNFFSGILGAIAIVVALIGVLAKRDVEKGLAATEREVLDTAKTMLASELAVVQDIELAAAHAQLDEVIAYHAT